MKGTGLLKLFVLSLFTLGISYFGLLGSSVNAVNHSVGFDSFNSTLDNSFNITALKGGAFLTNYLGVSKSVFALDLYNMIWRATSGRPYCYLKGSGGTRYQGFFQYYKLCDVITGENSNPMNNCNIYPTAGNFDSIKNFFNTVGVGDYFYYSYNPSTIVFNICWSSSSFNKTLCYFRDSSHSLINSNDYDYTFSNIPSNILGYAPGQGQYGSSTGGNIEGGDVITAGNTMTGNIVSSQCDKKLALSWYLGQGYRTRTCYSSYLNNTDLYTGPGDAQGYALTGTDILSVYNDTSSYRRYGLSGDSMSYSEWFSYWRKTFDIYYNNYNDEDSNTHSSPFLGVPISVYLLMANVHSYSLPYTDSSVMEFCNLSLYSQSELNTPYTGLASNVVCNLSPIEVLALQVSNENNPDGGLPAYNNNGTIGPVGSSWDGITNRSGFGLNSASGLNTFTDGKTFENNVFDLVKNSFRYVEEGGHSTPLIPSYIVLALCGIVLFRFISH